MAPRTNQAKASLLDDKIDILGRDAVEASSAKQVFRNVGTALALVRDKLTDDKDSLQLSEYCSNVHDVLKTVAQGRNEDDESVRSALRDLRRIAKEIERTLRNAPQINHNKGKVKGQNSKIRGILDSLNAPNPPFDETLPIPSRNTVTTPRSGGACKRLARRAFTLHELPFLIEVIFSSRDESDMIRRLLGDDAQAFIDVIDEMLDRPDLPPRARKNCLKLLYRTCGDHALVPTTLKVPISYDRTTDALYRGGFADVWKGEHCGRDVAVKVIRTYSNADLKKIIGRFCKEVVTWRALQHPNILPLIGVTMSETKFEMVSDWMVNGNINDFVKACPDANRLELLEGVARGLMYIHSQGMIHGDLKGVNILIDETGRALLADFGLLTIISDPTNFLSSSSYAQGGTVRWMSPERIAPQKFGSTDGRPTKPSDCYALGMVVYETISGNHPFHRHTDLIVFMKVVEGERPPRGAGFTKSLWEMLELCWTAQPKNRPSVDEVLHCLEMASDSSESPSPKVDEATDDGCNGSDPTTGSSGVLNRTSDTTTTEWSATMSFDSGYLIDRSPSPVEAISDADLDGPDNPPINLRLQTPPSQIDSNEGRTHQSPHRVVIEVFKETGELGSGVQTPGNYQPSGGQDPPQPPPTSLFHDAMPSKGLNPPSQFRMQLNNLLNSQGGVGRLRWGHPIRGGPDHHPSWTISAFLDGMERGSGTGASLKLAKEDASRQVLRLLLTPNFAR